MDKELFCRDCGQQFIFTEREQAFFVTKGFVPPKRCLDCRLEKKRRNEGRMLDDQARQAWKGA